MEDLSYQQTAKPHLHIVVGIIVAAVFVAAIALILSYYHSNAAIQTSTPTTSITQKTLSFSQLYSIINSTQINYPWLYYFGTYSVNTLQPSLTPQCFGPFILKWYLADGLANLSSPISESMANASPIFAEYIKASMLNSTNLKSYTNRFYANKGYCEDFMTPIKENSTFSSTQVEIDNASGFLMKLENMNSNALNLSSTPYIGQMPNVSFYVLTLIYKNITVSVGVWGFTGHMNGVESNMTATASALLNKIESQTS